MHYQVVFAFVFLSFVSVGSALQCYACGSSESWAMCMKNKFVKTCEPWEDRCYKASVDTFYKDARVTRFTRGCTSAKQCYDKSMNDCRGGEKKDHPLACDVFCCSGYICNAATLPVVSSIVVATCALVALVFF